MPRVSIFLVVKNGMPHVVEAVDSVRAQTYRDLELIVQDGASTDGTREYLEGLDVPFECCVDSRTDAGVAQAANRALGRCRGDVIGSIDADNLLEPDAVERGVAFVDANPEVAVVYAGCKMVAEDGTLLYPWVPDEFDLLRLLTCELVPPFSTSFFVRRHVGSELVFDEAIATVPDYDLWLRLSHLPIRRLDAVLGSTRVSGASGTRRAASYDDFIRDKSFALDRYLDRFERNPVTEAVRQRALAGIRLWATESVYDIESGRGDQFERYLTEALELDPTSVWAERIGELPSTRAPEQPSEPEPEPDPEPEPERWRGLRLRRSRAGSGS
jgi:glycosyltransferase involved in cell wall biosynthesis